jgi:hypothetical protein
MSKRARGLYNYLTEEAKALYDKILNISFSDNFKNFTKKEISYLTHLYEEKVKEIKEEEGTRLLDEKDAYIIAVCVKMKNLSAYRNVNLTRTKFSTDQLSKKQKSDTRVKLNNTLKPLLR